MFYENDAKIMRSSKHASMQPPAEIDAKRTSEIASDILKVAAQSSQC